MTQTIRHTTGQNDISPNELPTGTGSYALKVRDESMIDIGVLDGDYVVIRRVEGANNGDIVVVQVDQEESTLRRIFHQNDGQIELRPENTELKAEFYPAQRVQVQGRMVGLFRACIYG